MLASGKQGRMSNIHEPVPANHSHGNYGGYGHNHGGSGVKRTALIIHTVGDVAAGLLGLWILLYMLKANQGNVFVQFVHGAADWLAWWSQDIFTMESEGLRVLLNYSLPAVIYLLIGHGIAARVRRA
jgi:hypothetical protein